MNVNPLVSIIVPVYGVEQYLEKCIGSVLNQTYDNIELILVDDGSPDRCGEICDEYEKKDSRIKVIHKENGGQGSARNCGLDIANGQYIMFLDSDDTIKSECVEELYNYSIQNNLDISCGNFEKYNEEGKLIGYYETKYTDAIINGVEAQEHVWYMEFINLAPWGKLYKRELWEEIRFKECRFYEDYATVHYVYLKAERFGYLHKAFVNYLVRSNSDVRSFNELKLKVLDIADDTVEFAEKNYPQLVPAATAKMVSTYFHIYLQLDDDSHPASERIKKVVKKYRSSIISDKRAKTKIRGACMLSYLGFKFVKFVFRFTK